MDKTAIRNYAVEARRKLIEAVKLKAQQLYIFEDSAKTLRPGTESERLQASGIFLSAEQLNARGRLYDELLHEDMPYKPALYNCVMENVACTWFNRLIALRIMEVNEWLPSNIRILSSREPGRVEPDALREVERLDYVNQAKVAELRAHTGINAPEKLYKYILISQCNALHKILPGMFEKENDYTELLLPDALLSKGGIVHDLVNLIHEDNFHIEKQGQIEIIGWLYQFYISEKKDEVFAGLKKNVKINKDTIPAATQLFTPQWIVKYMVENSLGRLWLDRDKAESGLSDEYVNASYYDWKYYIEDAEQTPEVAEQLRVLRSQSPVKRPEDIKLIDPCMGSGHILVYAFDILHQIYVSHGYSEREIPNLILKNNIYGLDIDDRAGQLAYFALMIKARSYNRRFFRQDNIPQPMVYAIPETKIHIFGLEKWLGASMEESDKKASFADLSYIVELFGKGKEYGSAMKVEREIDFERLRKYVHDFATGQIALDDTDFMHQAEHFDCLIDIAEVLAQKYDVVVTNPPYRGATDLTVSMTEYLKKNYPDSKSDLYAVFIERCGEMLKPNGYQAMITMQSWMALPSFDVMRSKIIASKEIINMIHLGANAFDEIKGEVVQTASFVLQNHRIIDYCGTYVRLLDGKSESEKQLLLLSGDNRYEVSQSMFSSIPNAPIVYDISKRVADKFSNYSALNHFAIAKPGMQTSDNDRFLRYWHEIFFDAMGFGMTRDESIASKKRWFPYNKGIGYRKWYGNTDLVLNYYNDGEELKYWLVNNPNDPSTKHWSRNMRNYDYYFVEGITFTAIGDLFSSRMNGKGFLFDTKGPTIFGSHLVFLCGFTNTKVFDLYNRVLCKQITKTGDSVNLVPVAINEESESYAEVTTLTQCCIDISRADWDSFETSWNFKTHPLIAFKGNWEEATPLEYADDLVSGAIVTEWNKASLPIALAFDAWERHCDRQFDTLKHNEEELNRIFIDIYGLQDELMPEVEEKDVTVRRADKERDIKSFISYAVGCMFGRYSLDEPGLVLAGGKFDMPRYKTYLPEDDNIIPIGSADYFENDIVLRFAEFVRKVYGSGTLSDNLNFIADALYPTGNGSAQEKIRRYFLNDFYKDHLKIYQKRPIYWLLDSGKKDGFKALFYLHRYDKYTISRVRTDYLHPLQRKYEAEIKRFEMLSASTDNARDKAAYRKEIDTLQAKIDECRIYDQVVSHIAHQQIELDLDDGVKVNYEKFQGVEVPKDNGKTEKMDLLGKI